MVQEDLSEAETWKLSGSHRESEGTALQAEGKACENAQREERAPSIPATDGKLGWPVR